MTPKSLSFRFVLAFGALAALAVLGGACSNQAEGERCSQLSSNGGNDDCLDGLVCTSSTDLGTGSDICCPPDRTQATTSVCAIKRAPVGGDAGIPDSSGADSASDTSTPDTSTTDSGPDAAREAAAEAGPDGATD